MEALIIVGLVAAGLVALKIPLDRKRELELAGQQSPEQIFEAAERAQKHFEKIGAVKSNTAKANNCEKALKELQKIGDLPETRDLIANYDDQIAQLQSLRKVLPVIVHVEKAYRHRLKGSDKAEKRALLDALYDIETNGVSDKDFEKANAYPKGTGEIIQRENIERRLRELGWEG